MTIRSRRFRFVSYFISRHCGSVTYSCSSPPVCFYIRILIPYRTGLKIEPSIYLYIYSNLALAPYKTISFGFSCLAAGRLEREVLRAHNLQNSHLCLSKRVSHRTNCVYTQYTILHDLHISGRVGPLGPRNRHRVDETDEVSRQISRLVVVIVVA